jgi:hypothetical protein
VLNTPSKRQANHLVEKQQNRWITALLSQRSGNKPDAAESADAMISVWQDIAAALHSIIGSQGIAALYDRSISLASKKHPWLASSRTGADNSVDSAALRSVLAMQSDSDAAAGAREFLQTFYDVLVGLIGPALCEQLLLPVRKDSAHADHEIRNL